MPNPIKYKNPAIILGFENTGLATARCLAQMGVPVHGISFNHNDIGRKTRCCKVVRFDANLRPGAVIDKLCQYIRTLPEKPVLIPSGDSLALLIAQYQSQLAPVAYTSNCSYEQLRSIIHKNELYEKAAAADVPVPPMIITDDPLELRQWCQKNSPPYLVKPYFQNIEDCPIDTKNQNFDSADALLGFIHSTGINKLVIQQLLMGGDGHIYDCYGICNGQGKPIKFASHKRIRQWQPDFGSTCYGEIPGFADANIEQKIFSDTQKLLDNCYFHGIFGIEWLYDIKSDQYYMIDFNARPFSSIGHLKDCGLNLPFIHYQELLGLPLDSNEPTPRLEHKYWIHFARDLQTLPGRLENGSITFTQWLLSLFRVRSCAMWSSADPVPALVELGRLIVEIARFLKKRITGQR